MSLWISKHGRGENTILLLPIAEMLLPTIIFLALIITFGLNTGLLLTGIGLILFLAAKTSLIAKGISVSRGSKLMSPVFRTCYRLGYGLMIAGLLAVLFSLKINSG